MATKSWWICMSIILLTSCTSSIFVVHSIATTPDKTCWDIAKMPIFSYHPGKNWNLRQMNARFPPSPYPKLFRIAWQLYMLVFRPRQLWIGGGEGAYFFCLEETGSRVQKLENRWNCLNSFVWGWRLQSNIYSTYSTEDKLKILAAEVSGHLLVTSDLKWKIDHLH